MHFTNNYHKKSVWAFTLIEMIIVLVVIGILAMAIMWMSGDQITKVQNKAIKEAILSEWQSRYSMNLGSSSYAGNIYKYMDINLNSWSNLISFTYSGNFENRFWNQNFSNLFIIKDIIINKNEEYTSTWDIFIRYTPYNIKCTLWDDDISSLILITTVRDSKDYCFEINKNNCRLIEIDCKDER